ncbi:hypothetical protein BFP97_06205 [Roseivirga sp. 4D4]|uniref:ABC transporter permease n=1 Tax=Roseivirga sp. 4D4 TaxID=1889784 RepID=UPI000853EE4C|nr:ABC transporter permease [Roseivirga sp. 4D4]OEK01124.1 hypothetical protein BFP97_06205 [Roseivirga sp. 4D4]
MWSNYILTSLRTIKKNKLFVGINLISIALAFSLCTIAYFNVQFNSDFNTFFSKAQDLYKVNSNRLTADGTVMQGTTPLPLAQSINDDIANVKAVRYHRQNKMIKLEDQFFRQSIGFVDPEFLDFFEIPTISGSNAQFSGQQDMFINPDVAIKYFGKEDPIGKELKLVMSNGRTLGFTVKGVVVDLPKNTSFMYDIIIPFETYTDINGFKENDWSQWIDGTFLYGSTIDTDQVVSSLKRYIEAQNESNQGQELASYSVSSILEWPAFENSMEKSNFMGHLHPASVLGTLSSAIAVLLLASFNFINTSIAISRKRLKEIGMRKVLGGRKQDLKVQFLVESLVQMLIAVLLSGLITYFLTDAYNSMFEFEIVEFSRISLGPFLAFMLGVWLITGLLAGIYPAFYISRFSPLQVLKNKVRFSKRNLFTKSLLTFQLMVCVYNVFSLILFIQNTQYQEGLDRGYSVKTSINVPINDFNQFQVLKSEFEGISTVKDVTGTVHPIGFQSENIRVDYLGESHDVASLQVGNGYLENLDIRLSRGDFFGENEEDNFVIVNQMFAEKLGNDVLGQQITNDRQRFTIIGVVDDFNLRTIMLDNKIRPSVIFFSPESNYKYANVLLSTNDPLEANRILEDGWNKLFPEEQYLGFLQEDVLKPVRQTNNIMLSINSFVAVVTLIISALGLYAMVFLNIQSRIKEFGVRKVLGASVKQILYLINREVIVMLSIASIGGVTLGYFVINMILDIVYAYHTETSLNNFVLPILVVTAIVIMAIGYRTWQSARENPVEHLRFE